MLSADTGADRHIVAGEDVIRYGFVRVQCDGVHEHGILDSRNRLV